METLHFDLSKAGGVFKPLNATNGGPWHKRHCNDQWRDNLDAYKAARIPYSRNHDSAMLTIYGGPYSHDVSCIFPDFDADPRDPASYDFACTDEAILISLDAGTETYFRLGQTIEHQIKKHATLPPKDFHKWAVICEHIIRHYNEGWANGLHLNIQYWEIWNEPDLDLDDSPNKRTWGGTKAQFFDLYEIAAKHLKACFPHLKIGGPALAGREDWAEDFLGEMEKRQVPMDFFSWHIYCNEPHWMVEKADRIHQMMVSHGYGAAESILNEWNYIKNWEDQFVYSVRSIIGMKGAAFTMACISVAQHSPIDLLMYYDTRMSCFNGVFDYYTFEPLKGYYPLYWYGMFYDCTHEIPSENTLPEIFSLCGVQPDGKLMAVITRYSDNDTEVDKDVAVDFGRDGRFEVYRLDENHDGTVAETVDSLTFTMPVHSCILIKEK